MIKRYKYLFFLVLVAVVFTGCGGGGGSTPGVGSIVGYVRYSGSQTPVAGAYLEVVNNYGPQYGRTEQDGSFEITGIRAGTATLIIQHPGIKGGEHRHTLTVPSGGTNTLTVFVTPGSAETGGVIGWVYVPEKSQLMASSLQEVEPLLSSQATAPRGYEPLQNAQVRLGIRSTTTNAQGKFFFTDLAPGSYTLEVTHDSLRFPIEEEVRVYKGTTTWLGDYGKEPLFGGIGHYLVIGIDYYPQQKLAREGAVEDALAVFEALYLDNRLAGFGELLISREHNWSDGLPERERIRKSIEKAANMADSPDDYLVIYFSGEAGIDFLSPMDDDGRPLESQLITDVELDKWISKFPGNVTLIIESDNSETMADSSPFVPFGPLVLETDPKYTVLASALDGQDAGLHATSGLSWFTHHLVEGITKNKPGTNVRLADSDGYGDITALELFQYTRDEMYKFNQGKEQSPHFHKGLYGDTVIFRY